MRLSPDVAGYTDQMVSDCALSSASIFFYEESEGQANLSYLYHVGVSQEAQYRYNNGRVFEADPFTRQLLAQGRVRGEGFVRWGDAALERFVGRSYSSFLDHYAVEVVGASTRMLAPGLCLVIGTHRRGGDRLRADVPLSLLQRRVQTLSGLVVDRFLAELVDSRDGWLAVRSTLGSAPRSVANLSRREEQLARLICRGLQNKAIAFEAGLSENTVENYLRRLYRKLGVRNRAGLVSTMTQRLH